MSATLERPALRSLPDDELAALYASGDDVTMAACVAEMSRRDRAARARAASRERHSGWEAAAHAQYQAAEAYCRGNLLSEAGKRRGREAWPMLWMGSEEDARKLASDELVTFWDWQQPRVPGPRAYAATERAEAAETHARQDQPSPGMLAAIAAARGETSREAPPPVAATAEPGAMVRFTALLREMRREAELTARSLERVRA